MPGSCRMPTRISKASAYCTSGLARDEDAYEERDLGLPFKFLLQNDRVFPELDNLVGRNDFVGRVVAKH